MNIKISAYTTTRNAVSMDYPVSESIQSMLQFADEVVVLDTSTTDPQEGTLRLLYSIQEREPRVRVTHTNSFDWSAPNHGIFDGQTKALARSLCKNPFLYQFDIDEVVHELDAPKIKPFIEKMDYLTKTPLVALPVIEYWGSKGKVRVDINIQKWRLSRNLPDITHGIPSHLRTTINGLSYAKEGTDTCDYISRTTGEVVPCVSFPVPKTIRSSPEFEKWFNGFVESVPGVHHYSWFSIKRKIKQYKMFWNNFWKAMYGPNLSKDPNWNPFFNVPFSEVTDEMIDQKARELEEMTGGHIFHTTWNGTKTPSIRVNRDHPSAIKEWIKKVKNANDNT